MPLSSICLKTITISESVIDKNGHVNNVAYVQWMHAESVLHWNITNPLVGATWVVREHRIEYLLPAFAGEEIEFNTRVENIPRSMSEGLPW